GKIAHESLKPGSNEMFAFQSGQNGAKQIQILERVLCGIEDLSELLSEEKCDEPFNDHDDKERRSFSPEPPHDCGTESQNGQQGSEPSHPMPVQAVRCTDPL